METNSGYTQIRKFNEDINNFCQMVKIWTQPKESFLLVRRIRNVYIYQLASVSDFVRVAFVYNTKERTSTISWDKANKNHNTIQTNLFVCPMFVLKKLWSCETIGKSTVDQIKSNHVQAVGFYRNHVFMSFLLEIPNVQTIKILNKYPNIFCCLLCRWFLINLP